MSCTTIWQIPQGWESSYHLQRHQGCECSEASERPGGQNREREEERQSVGWRLQKPLWRFGISLIKQIKRCIPIYIDSNWFLNDAYLEVMYLTTSISKNWFFRYMWLFCFTAFIFLIHQFIYSAKLLSKVCTMVPTVVI